MATDPQIVKKLSEDLDNLNDLIDNLSKTILSKLNTSLAATSEEVKNLTIEFEKGNDITNKVEDSLRKAQKENRKLGLDQNSLQAKLNNLITSANTGYVKNFKTKKANLEQQIQEIQAQMRLNDSVIEYLKYLGEVNAQQKLNNSLAEKSKKTYSTLKDIGLIGFFTSIFNYVLKADEQLTNMGKSMGISKNAARDIRNEFAAYARETRDGFITTERLVKAQLELTEQLGFGAKFSNQELETFSRLTEIVGLTSQEAAQFNKLSAATGMEAKDYVKSVRSAAFYASQTNKINISDKELLSSIAKLSAGILVKFQSNPKALAQAIVEAKKLGSSLEQIDKIGESLLNWESSIENELKAELITGKQLNLEKARYAALTGNQLDLTREIANQVGTLNDYQNMNVIAQKSLAEAFGLSRDEMSEMLMKQEAINKYGDKAAELNAKQIEDLNKSGLSLDDYLAKQKEQQSIQEKFNQAMIRLQEIVGNLVEGPIGKLLNFFVKILDTTGGLIALSGIYITRLITTIALKRLEAKYAQEVAQGNMTAAAGKAAESAASIPIIGWGLAAGAALALFATLSGLFSKGDDVISPGYGKRMLLDEGSITAFNDNDTIIAGTNLGGENKSNIKNSSGIDFSPMIAAINEVRNAVNELKNRPAIAYINGEDAFARNLGTVNALGTSQTQNSYKLA